MDAPSKILKSAEILFAEQGFGGTSIREITEASSTNIAMISYYFGSKEALYHRLVNERVASLSHGNMRYIGLSAWQEMNALIDTHVNLVSRNPYLFKIIARELLIHNSLIKDIVTKFWGQYHDTVKSFVRTTDNTTNIDFLIATLFNTPIQLLALDNRTDETPSIIKRDLKKLFFSMLSPEVQAIEQKRNSFMIHDWAI